MTPRMRYDWEQVAYDCLSAIENGCEPKIIALSQELGIGRGVLSRGLRNHLGLTAKDLPNLGSILNLQQRRAIQDAVIVFKDKKQREDIDWREFIDKASTNQEFERRLDDTQRIAEITVNTDRPFGIVMSGDWHLGDQYTDHETWKRDIEFILSTPQLGMIDVGDDRQNARTFRALSVVLGQVLSPKEQALMMRGIVDELTVKSKLIAKIGGNHDEEWDEKIFGEALQAYLLENMKAPRFRNRGLVKITVGEVLYTILVFHKSRFRSFLRKAHGAMREHQLSYPADVVVGGHDHQPALEHFYHYTLAREADMGFGGETLLIKVGTYQDGDFGWRYYHNGGLQPNYTVVFYPDQHKMIPFTNMYDAAAFMNAIS